MSTLLPMCSILANLLLISQLNVNCNYFELEYKKQVWTHKLPLHIASTGHTRKIILVPILCVSRSIFPTDLSLGGLSCEIKSMFGLHYGEEICQSWINPHVIQRKGEALLWKSLGSLRPEEGCISTYMEWGCKMTCSLQTGNLKKVSIC
jgi:hypothetical protein